MTNVIDEWSLHPGKGIGTYCCPWVEIKSISLRHLWPSKTNLKNRGLRSFHPLPTFDSLVKTCCEILWILGNTFGQGPHRVFLLEGILVNEWLLKKRHPGCVCQRGPLVPTRWPVPWLEEPEEAEEDLAELSSRWIPGLSCGEGGGVLLGRWRSWRDQGGRGRGQGGGEHGLVEGAGDQPGDVDHMELDGVRVLGTSSSWSTTRSL